MGNCMKKCISLSKDTQMDNTHHSNKQRTANNSSPSQEEVIVLLQAVKDGIDVDYLINFINTLLQSTTSDQVEMDSSETRKVIGNILNQVGNIHWVVGGLSIIAYLLKKVQKMSDNRSHCLQLLKYMINLSSHIKRLNHEIREEEEKLQKSLHIIVEASIICAAQLQSRKIFSFMKTSLNTETLRCIQSRINQLYPDLILTTITAIKHQQPVVLPIRKPAYPDYAVGIDEGAQEIIELLNLATTEESSRAVVIYGLGGIGKSTLVAAVLAILSLEDFSYARVGLHEDPLRNDLKTIQEVILKDGFPNYEGGAQIVLRDCEEGRDRIMQAFKCEGNKPLFLFIDNLLRAEDLKELLPADFNGLPRRSRILVTTRNMRETDMFEGSGLQRYHYLVKTLSTYPALKILSKDSSNLQNSKEEEVNRILNICGGIPLVLNVVVSHLAKMGYDTEQCTQIIEALENGEEIKEENLSTRLMNYVYDRLETSTQEAFLDICCFYNNWNRRHVECIVGAEQVKLLQEAALVTTSLPLTNNSKDEEKLIVHNIIQANGIHMFKSTRIMDVQSLIKAV
ncbi:hypothetical protein KI387_035692 [Taxus chinensis]|uniref:NB-ARC domain-containing protein n=1 Tax=Taxus chinensis TaxID=29808 RepID=A0AA38FPI2_TAXCH|nr:hypothetical protein KI387_035692 [Taxus chinensis]